MSRSSDKTDGPAREQRADDWDPGPVAVQRLINSLKSNVVDRSATEHDPLEEKHKARAYRQDFRTVDYRKLSRSEDERMTERERIKAMHSTWVPSSKPKKSAPPSSSGKFASFGGNTIRAEVIRKERKTQEP